jgi:hypothetical protein
MVFTLPALDMLVVRERGALQKEEDEIETEIKWKLENRKEE